MVTQRSDKLSVRNALALFGLVQLLLPVNEFFWKV